MGDAHFRQAHSPSSSFSATLPYCSTQALQYRLSSLPIPSARFPSGRHHLRRNHTRKEPPSAQIRRTSLQSMAQGRCGNLLCGTVSQSQYWQYSIQLTFALGLFCYLAGIWCLILQIVTYAILQEPNVVRIPITCVTGFAVIPLIVYIIPSCMSRSQARKHWGWHLTLVEDVSTHYFSNVFHLGPNKCI